MGRSLPILSCKEVVSALEKVDFKEIPKRGKGSHVFVYRSLPPKGITIPNSKEIKRGTLRAIIRQAGLSVDEFIDLL